MKPINDKILYIVHAIDVEGPMTETLEATFERMRAYGLPENVSVSNQNLELIQEGRLEGIAPELAGSLKRVFNKRALAYLTDWDQIDAMIRKVTSASFRQKFTSGDGTPYVFSWFIYDHHHGFTNNPRFHEAGTQKIFDHYMKGLLEPQSSGDGIYWHYHHTPVSGNALESNTCWTNRNTHEEIIARRIIERKWYFSVFRAGLHIERNDLSHWMEMFFPFDFSARYDKNNFPYTPGIDFDWRGCPPKWGGWHPDWYDYRKEGQMKRYLFRCTDLFTYYHQLNEEEVREAFEQAENNGNAVLTYYNHDYRDMEQEIDDGYRVIRKVAAEFPNIKFKNVNALDAARGHLGINGGKPVIEYLLDGSLLTVKIKGEIFGPQPFLAILENEDYFRDNFTDEGNHTWAYRFRNPGKVRAFGIAACSPSGEYDLKVHRF
jgi:hypothetical protein